MAVLLTPNDIAALIVEVRDFAPAGMDKPTAIKWFDTAIAICLAESGGNLVAKSSISTATGLWQILVSAHGPLIAEQVAKYKKLGEKNPDIFNPHVNTGCAASIYRAAGGWTPWEVYTKPISKPAYLGYLGHGAAAYEYVSNKANVNGNAIEDFLNGVKDPAGALKNSIVEPISDATNKALTFFKDAGIVIGVFILGAILLILGFWYMASQTNLGKTAISTAAKVGPISKIVK